MRDQLPKGIRANAHADPEYSDYHRHRHADADANTVERGRMKLSFSFALAAFLFAISLPTSFAEQPNTKITSEIETVIRAQQDAWNRGDIDAFMDGYWRSGQTVFISGDNVTRGWQKVLDRYRNKYSNKSKMGSLTFSDLEITPLSDDSAVVLGSWRLQRAGDSPHGRFTLIFRHFPEGWKIVHDHTSAAEAAKDVKK
jgi:ketosteroid isomerase-like protein